MLPEYSTVYRGTSLNALGYFVFSWFFLEHFYSIKHLEQLYKSIKNICCKEAKSGTLDH